MNTGVMFSKKSDEWETPQYIFDELNSEFKFSLDPCATHQNTKCKCYFTVKEDGLKQDWFTHNVFVNPPYSKVSDWVKKAYEEHLKGATIVMLLPARTDTKWFHTYVLGGCAKVRFIKGRLKFGDSKNSAPFPSMVVIYQ